MTPIFWTGSEHKHYPSNQDTSDTGVSYRVTGNFRECGTSEKALRIIFHGYKFVDDSNDCCLLTPRTVGRASMMFWPCPSSPLMCLL